VLCLNDGGLIALFSLVWLVLLDSFSNVLPYFLDFYLLVIAFSALMLAGRASGL